MTSNHKELDAYKIWLSRTKRPTTSSQYYGTVRDFVMAYDKSIPELTLVDVTLYVEELHKKFSAETVIRYTDRIRSFLRFIDKSSIADKMPVMRNPAPPVDEIKEDVVEFIPEDKLTILFANTTNTTEYAILQIGYHFGMRVNEIPLLKKSWINPESKTCRIYRLKTNTPWQELPFDHRTTIIHDSWAVLQSYMCWHQDPRIDTLFVPEFNTGMRSKLAPDKPIHAATIEQIFHKIVKRAASNDTYFEKLVDQNSSFHILRHSKGTNMIISQMQDHDRVSLIEVTKWLHHRNYNTTLRYVHLAASFLGRKNIEDYL